MSNERFIRNENFIRDVLKEIGHYSDLIQAILDEEVGLDDDALRIISIINQKILVASNNLDESITHTLML